MISRSRGGSEESEIRVGSRLWPCESILFPCACISGRQEMDWASYSPQQWTLGVPQESRASHTPSSDHQRCSLGRLTTHIRQTSRYTNAIPIHDIPRGPPIPRFAD